MGNDQGIFMDDSMYPPSMLTTSGMQGQHDTPPGRANSKAHKSAGHKRRNFFIKKDYQARFIIRFCIVVLLGGFISTGLIFFGTQGTVTSHFANSQLCIHNTSQTILPCVICANVATTVITLILAIWLTMRASHKIAGTLFRFEKDLGRLAGGDLDFHFQVRRGDQLSDLGNSLNLVLDSLNHSLKAIQTDVDQVARMAEQDATSQELLDAIKQVQSRIETSYTLK